MCFFVFFYYDKGDIQDIKSGGYPFVTLEYFFVSPFSEHGDIAYFADIVSPSGYHTNGVTSFWNVTLHLKLPY